MRWLADRAERHHGRRREVDVVVSDEGDVAGHLHVTHQGERLQRSHGEEVVRGEDGVRTLRRRPHAQGLTGGTALQHRERGHLDDLERGIRDLGHGSPRALETIRDLPEHERSAHVRDPPASDRQQVRHREVAALDIVDRHRGEAAGRVLVVHEDHLDASAAQALQPFQVAVDGSDEHPVHALLPEQVEVGVLALGTLVAVAEQHAHARLCRTILGATRDLREEGVARVEHHECDRATATGAQLTRRVVAHEAQLVDRTLHALDRRGGDLGGPVEHVRDGAD
jgi:hypothetical protein